jgi:hypothetical protein
MIFKYGAIMKTIYFIKNIPHKQEVLDILITKLRLNQKNK